MAVKTNEALKSKKGRPQKGRSTKKEWKGKFGGQSRDAQSQIQHLQNSNVACIPAKRFNAEARGAVARLAVAPTRRQSTKSGIKLAPCALRLLREASEAHIVDRFVKAQMVADTFKKKCVSSVEWGLVNNIESVGPQVAIAQ